MVLLIVSIMSGIVISRMPAVVGGVDFDTEANRLKTLLDLAREEAQIQSMEMGFNSTDEGYAFYVYDEYESNWVTFEQAPFQARVLPDGLDLRLHVAGDSPGLSNAGSEGDEEDAGITPLLILSSGEVQPFSLTLSYEREQAATLNCDGYGEIEWDE